MNFFKNLVDKFQTLKAEDIQGASSAISGIMGVADATFGKSGVDRTVEAPSISRDTSGRPIYNQEQFIEANRDFRKGIKGTVGRGILQGAAGGLQAGMSLSKDPLTVAITTGVGAVGGLIGGAKRRKAMLREATRREDLSTQAISGFNTAAQNYSESLEADDFRDAILRRRRTY